jgi:Kyakuja-Dileera-Zisupton transposase
MENHWEDVCGSRSNNSRPSRRARVDTLNEEDGYEGDLRVPTSVLDGCEASFTAADAAREKASTQFFDDTALMALLCRHDRVLWIANMHSAGEKRHYALVLLEMLFQHLPQNFTVGALYDISCQLHRTCIKWEFLDRYLDHLIFAISVFHAFGHRWACQLVYHPRKCEGFGLSDGEGCERFWHSISKLIAYLRVCGVCLHCFHAKHSTEYHFIASSTAIYSRSASPPRRS